MFLNIVGLFLNEYMPVWFPALQLVLFAVFAAGLVLIATWWCNDTRATRTNLRIAAYLLLGSVCFQILIALIYVGAACNSPYVMVGTGDKEDPDNYDKMPKTLFILGYIFFGLILIVLILGLLWAVEKYKD